LGIPCPPRAQAAGPASARPRRELAKPARRARPASDPLAVCLRSPRSIVPVQWIRSGGHRSTEPAPGVHLEPPRWIISDSAIKSGDSRSMQGLDSSTWYHNDRSGQRRGSGRVATARQNRLRRAPRVTMIDRSMSTISRNSLRGVVEAHGVAELRCLLANEGGPVSRFRSSGAEGGTARAILFDLLSISDGDQGKMKVDASDRGFASDDSW
jgi:hypothetical protein